MGTFIDQNNRPDSAGHRRQFDLAANIDVSFVHGERIEGVLQLQTGSGGSSIGFVGSENPEVLVALTNANLSYHIPKPGIVVTVGSFDTPFGEETGRLTNNGDASANSFFLNSLFYSAFAGTQVGTLNTLGMMGNWHTETVDVTLATTNGTDEAAGNPDGNFEIVARLGMSPIPFARLAGSYLHSDDNSSAGSSGTESLFSDWLAEGGYDLNESGALRGYIGQIVYDDGAGATEDEVVIWMLEGAVQVVETRFAARVSGWAPSNDNGDGASISRHIGLPGLAAGFEPDELAMNQQTRRYQFSVTRNLVPGTGAKLEFVFDDLQHGLADGRSADALGVLLGVNATF
ncbi:MAG: hypothetical protein GY867_09460 [bacterium]|nr:hypothetical protein [bacterium]